MRKVRAANFAVSKILVLIYFRLPRDVSTCVVFGDMSRGTIVIPLSVRLLSIVCRSRDGNAIPWPMLILQRKVTSDTNKLSYRRFAHPLR